MWYSVNISFTIIYTRVIIVKKKNGRIISTSVIIIILCCVVFVYSFFNGYSGLHLKKEVKKGQIKVACVGDSVTYGYGLEDWHKTNYPAVLQTLLGDGYNVRNFGDSGKSVQNILFRDYSKTITYSQSIDYEADILVFMLGTNDSIPNYWKNEGVFKEQYLALLDTYLVGENPPRVYLCTPTRAFYKDKSQTSGPAFMGIQDDVVVKICEIVKEIAEERGYECIDIYKLTKDHPEYYSSDMVHPNPHGAEALAKEIYRNIKPE